MNKNYGQRACLVCKTVFEATYPGQVCCSDSCKKTRERVLHRERDVRGRLRRKKELEALKARVAELECLRDELDRARLELASRKAELAESREELETLRRGSLPRKEEKNLRRTVEYPTKPAAPAVDTSNWDYCKHMQLRAPKLPCGEREECQRCERTRPLVLEPGDKVCAKCKQVFTPKAPAQKYCSKSCQEDAARAKIYGRKK